MSGVEPATRSATTENVKQKVAILVFMAVVRPEKSGISKIGICVPLNYDFMFIYSTMYHRSVVFIYLFSDAEALP